MALTYNIYAPRIVKDETTDGIRHLTVIPSNRVCCNQIDIDLDTTTNTVASVKFTNGCDGNTQGVAALIKGMDAAEACSRICGINCHGKGTSCPDQLGLALRSALDSTLSEL